MNRKILAFALLLTLLITIVPATVSTFGVTSAASPNTEWTLVTNARAMKAYSDLKEYVWQKNASMAPNGQYDKIGLHRIIKTDAAVKGVVFMVPGLYGNGEKLVSNPANDSFAKTEDTCQCIYWANRGFDVYTIDYRQHFIPLNFNKTQLSFTADWGMDQVISDIKEAVDKAKEVSGASKVFLSGMSWGGILSQIYAAKYWQQDLRGLVLLDPAPPKSTLTKNQNLTNSYNLTATANAMKAAGGWVYENPQQSSTPSPLNPGYIFLLQFAAQNPGAPAQYLNGTLVTTINPRTNRTWANITEWLEYNMNTANSSNTYGGYGNITYNMIVAPLADRYYPVKQFIDYAAMLDWAVCPYLPYDYLAHISEINVPVLAFRSGLNLAAYGNITNGMATTDFTWKVLPNYGHSDVFQGTYSARDVSEPAYQWMIDHLLHTDPYTDPTAVSWNVDSSFSFMDMIKGNHTFVPADKVANPVQKLTISYDEKPLTCNINVGGVTYSLGKDFTYTGHVDYIYYNPTFNSPTLGYYYPSSFSGTETTVSYMYNFSAVPGGLEGTLSMFATMKDAVGSIVSVGGTGDFKNVEVKATISPQWYDAANLVVNIYHDGMVSGWPKAVPAFMTTNIIVSYAQLTDYCVNVWGLPSNPYPAYPANVTTEYHIFNFVIGDKFYLMVGCGTRTSAISDPVAKTVTLTLNSTWYFGDSYKGVAKMDQGFNGPVVATLLNYTPANATATPPTPATYDIGPTIYNLKGFGALSGQSIMLRVEGQVMPFLAKGYAILP